MGMRPYQEQTFYELLEIAPTAEQSEIRAAHERAQTMLSTDSVALYSLVGTDETQALRERLNAAAEALLDPKARARYDRVIGLHADEEETDGSAGYGSGASGVSPGSELAGRCAEDAV